MYLTGRLHNSFADVHQTAAGIGQGSVVQTGQRQIEFAERFADVHSRHFIGNAGSEVAPVEVADFSGLFSDVSNDCHGIHVFISSFLDVT